MQRYDSQYLLDMAFLDAAQGAPVDVGADLMDLLLEDISSPAPQAALEPLMQHEDEPKQQPPVLLPNIKQENVAFYPYGPQATASLDSDGAFHESSSPSQHLNAQAGEGTKRVKKLPSFSSGATSSGDISDDVYVPPAGVRSKGQITRRGDNDQTPYGGKKRVRNAQQMELNRIAQAKYRERKKQERTELQAAVDELAAQVAAFKVLEEKANALEAENAALQAALAQKDMVMNTLQHRAASQATELQAASSALLQCQQQVEQQQQAIDSHADKIELQDQVITCLKEQLRDKADEACTACCADPGVVRDKIMAAVRTAMYGNSNMQALTAQLEGMPQQVYDDICKNIFAAVREVMQLRRMQHCTALAARASASACAPCCYGV